MPALTTSRRAKVYYFIILALTIVILNNIWHIDKDEIQGFLSHYPLALSAFIFVFLYVIVTFFLWFSKDIFRFLAAVIFGVYWSTFLVLLAELVNAVILFNLSRYLGKDFAEKKLGFTNSQIAAKIREANFLWLALFRAAPVFPFRFLDIGAGVAGVSFKKYFGAIVLGSPLRIFWLQLVLAGVGEISLSSHDKIWEYLAGNKVAFVLTFIYLLLAMVIVWRLNKKEHGGRKDVF